MKKINFYSCATYGLSRTIKAIFLFGLLFTASVIMSCAWADNRFILLRMARMKFIMSKGNCIAIANRDGLTQYLYYISAGLLDHVTDNFGHALQFKYIIGNGDTISLLSEMIDPAGKMYTYIYTPSSTTQKALLASVIYPDKTTQSYLYQSTDA